jgi:hypothetical protein
MSLPKQMQDFLRAGNCLVIEQTGEHTRLILMWCSKWPETVEED